jgi:hypothetical protein
VPFLPQNSYLIPILKLRFLDGAVSTQLSAFSYRHEADPPFTVDRLPKEDVGQRLTDNNHADG